MPDFDAGFKIVAHHAGKQLARVAGVMSETWEPLTGELHATERLADRAFLAGRNDKPFVVYMEAYTRWKKEAPWSMLEKMRPDLRPRAAADVDSGVRVVASRLSVARRIVSPGS